MVGWISAHTVFMVCNSYRRKMCVVLFARGICKKGQPCSCISEMLSQNWLVGKTLPLWLIGSHVTSVHLQWKKPSETYRIISGTKLTPPQGFGDAKPSDQGMIFPPRQCRSQWAFGTICCARWCGSAFAQQPGHFGILARTMNKFLMSWSLIPMIVFHAACAFDTIYSHFLFGFLSLSLCIYISAHVFDSNGWFIGTISIYQSCLWECSIHLHSDICETLLLMFCQDDRAPFPFVHWDFWTPCGCRQSATGCHPV